MPWQSGSGGSGGNGGGPWGGGSGGGDDGNKNPWGQKPGGGGGNRGGGPNLDDLLRRGQDRLKSGLPGGPGGGRILGYGALGLLALWLATSSFYRVNEGEVAVIQQFGRYVDSRGAGLQFKLPSPIQSVTKVKVEQVNEIEIGAGEGSSENLVLTGDQNIVDVAYTVRWKIKSAENYLFQIDDPQGTIREVCESAMREAMAQTKMEDAIGALRDSVAKRVEARAQSVLDSYKSGVVISGVFIKQVDPPQKVIQAFRDVTAARSDAFTSLNKANAYRQQLLAGAQGDAARFNAVYEQYKLAPEVTRKRLYLETMEEVLGGTNKVIVDGKGVVPYLPLPQLTPPAPSITATPAGNSTR